MPSLNEIKKSRSKELRGFFETKTIQHPYNFFVTIINDDKKNIGELGRQNTKVDPSVETDQTERPKQSTGMYNFEVMPTLESWHVRGVNINSYDFKKEVLKYGIFPRSFPVLEFDGFELTIQFEEDENLTIAKLINWLQRRIIKENGIYRNPALHKLDTILVEINDNVGRTVARYSFPDAYFLKASELALDYTATEAVKYTITFGVDIIEQEFLEVSDEGFKNKSASGKIANRSINS